MKKLVLLILVLVSLATLIIRFSSQASEILLGVKPKAGISIMSKPAGAKVELEGKVVGETPFEDKDLKPADYIVKIEKDRLFWQGKVKLTSGTQTVVNRELAKDVQFQSGEILTLQKGKGITVISSPSLAEVEIDGKILGITPATFAVEAGEHTITISSPNYLKRSIRANLPANFNLIVALDLALSEADLSTIKTPPTALTEEVKVLDTPTGFLRVRDKPSLSGKEITRVKPDDTLILLEDEGAWYRVRLSDGTEGFVSSSYVEKKTQP